jgi:hypothetical protein
MRQMMKRRLEDAGLPDFFSPHSFRITVVTDLLNQNVPLEDVQYLAGVAFASDGDSATSDVGIPVSDRLAGFDWNNKLAAAPAATSPNTPARMDRVVSGCWWKK